MPQSAGSEASRNRWKTFLFKTVARTRNLGQIQASAVQQFNKPLQGDDRQRRCVSRHFASRR